MGERQERTGDIARVRTREGQCGEKLGIDITCDPEFECIAGRPLGRGYNARRR